MSTRCRSAGRWRGRERPSPKSIRQGQAARRQIAFGLDRVSGLLDAIEGKPRLYPLIEYGGDEQRLLAERFACRFNAPRGRAIGPGMKKIIWTGWFQGREAAPPLIKKCLRSWERNNPAWQFRFLDATSVERYVPVRQFIDLRRQSLTAASLSDIVRILLLREFGGVWVDATLFCNRPLDEWLPGVMDEGFFAFAAPAPDRPLSSWFSSGRPNNYLVSTWCRRTTEYWSKRAARNSISR